ncbi:MAG: PilC/PilY family type IV pilus protein [Colwellia sp.]
MNSTKQQYRYNLMKHTNIQHERTGKKSNIRKLNSVAQKVIIFVLLGVLGVFYTSNTLASNASDPSDLVRLTSTPMLEDECENEFDHINAQLKSSDSDTVYSGLISWYTFYKEAGAINPEGGITEHIQDFNDNGLIDVDVSNYTEDNDTEDKDTEDKDYHWVFFHLGRNGDSIYAIDFTLKDNPKMMWKISPHVEGFERLGQTWSKPKIAYSKFNLGSETAYEVLIFAGGYDTNKDKVGLGTDDLKGNAIYMVDAKSGELIWSLDANTSLGFTGVDSIPSAVSTLDSNGDGFIERLYVGDTGGNIWRVNMPTASIQDVSVQKFANLGRHSSEIVKNDQRFYYEPTIVRSLLPIHKKESQLLADGNITEVMVSHEQPFDIILIGSGKKQSQHASTIQDADSEEELSINQDSFYMLKDSHIITLSTRATSAEDSSAQNTSLQANATIVPIQKSALYNLTSNPFSNVTVDSSTTGMFASMILKLSDKQGWFIDYGKPNEVTTSSAWVINNKVVFTTTNTSSLLSLGACYDLNSEHWLYGIDLQYGYSRFNWTAETGDSTSRIKALGKGSYDQTKQLHIKAAQEGDNEVLSLMVGTELVGDSIALETKRLYLYVSE